MRLVTWNCNGAFRRKFEMVSALDPDLLVIQECEDPAFSSHDYRAWAGDYIWTGKGKNKGIGIFPRRRQSLERLDWPDAGFQMFLPVRVDRKIDLIAVWTQRSAQTNQAYIGQFWHYMQLHKSAWCENTIICGDFNSNTIWDQARRPWNHTDCVRELDGLGFRSLYHQTLKEPQGQEGKATFYLHRDLKRPYHIDYVFVRDKLLSLNSSRADVGEAADWLPLSDHMPIIADI